MNLRATLYRYVGRDDTNSTAQALLHPPLKEIVLPIGAEPVTSDPFPTYSHFVEIIAEADCLIGIGDSRVEPKHLINEGERLVYGVLENMHISVKALEG
jgi:hypothetical protein